MRKTSASRSDARIQLHRSILIFCNGRASLRDANALLPKCPWTEVHGYHRMSLREIVGTVGGSYGPLGGCVTSRSSARLRCGFTSRACKLFDNIKRNRNQQDRDAGRSQHPTNDDSADNSACDCTSPGGNRQRQSSQNESE